MSIKWMWLAAVLAVTPANAQTKVGVYITYAAWEALDQNERNAYIGGTLDGMLMFSRPETASFFYECLQREKLTIPQLTSEVEALGKSTPEVKQGAVQEALFVVLKNKCPNKT